MNQTELKLLTTIPGDEKDEFKKLIRDYRKRFIRSPQDTVDQIFHSRADMLDNVCRKHNISEVIHELREAAYLSFLEDEAKFNTEVLKAIGEQLATPGQILGSIIEQNNLYGRPKDELITTVKLMCGEYAGRISPYIYELSLSNTQSRRSRAGKTFEQVIYEIYRTFKFAFVSQGEVGRATFTDHGLGKIVDSLLPGIAEFQKRRDKVIIGTMKTTLRERWQEVIEEVVRTNLPRIYLLTMDDDISENKAIQMGKHNVVIVVPKSVKQKASLVGMENIISFESYFLEEIPETLRYWTK